MEASLELRYKKKLTLVTACVIIMYIVWTGVGWNCMAVYATGAIEDMGILRSQFMLTLTLCAVGHFLSCIFLFGPLHSKLGSRKYLIFPGILTVIGFLVLGSARGLAMLYLGGIMVGFGNSAFTMNMALILFTIWGFKNVGTMTAIAQTCGSVSGIVMAIVVGLLVNSVGWRTGWLITFIITGVVLIILLIIYKGDPESVGFKEYIDDLRAKRLEEQGAEAIAPHEDGISRNEMFKNPQCYVMIITYLLVGIIAYGVLANLPLFTSDFGYENFAASALSVGLIASAVMFTPIGMICDKLGSKHAITLCMICGIIAMILLTRSALPLPMLIIAALCAGVCYDGCLFVAGMSCKEAFGEKEYDKKVGIITGFDSLGVAFGPTILALFFDFSGSYNMGLYICIVVAIIIIFLIRYCTRKVQSKE